MDDLFAPPGERWQRLAPAYARVLQIRMLIVHAVLLAAVVIPLLFVTDWRWACLGAAVIVTWTIWRWFRLRRWVAAWGYAERDEDLYLTHGLWFKELTAIPYGRMQAVKVESGPLTRAFGLASVELVTAAMSGAKVPGLARAEAERLRDRLIAIGAGDQDGL